jgi:hypothetical protein
MWVKTKTFSHLSKYQHETARTKVQTVVAKGPEGPLGYTMGGATEKGKLRTVHDTIEEQRSAQGLIRYVNAAGKVFGPIKPGVYQLKGGNGATGSINIRSATPVSGGLGVKLEVDVMLKERAWDGAIQERRGLKLYNAHPSSQNAGWTGSSPMTGAWSEKLNGAWRRLTVSFDEEGKPTIRIDRPEPNGSLELSA